MSRFPDPPVGLEQASAEVGTLGGVSPSPVGASHNGMGILEIRRVVEIIENEGIACCVVGAKALRYYGVPRVSVSPQITYLFCCPVARDISLTLIAAKEDWSMCVPTNKVEYVKDLFTTAPHCEIYEDADQIVPTVRSLLHTYPRLRRKDVKFSFFIIPSWEFFMKDFGPSRFEYSSSHIPYPMLDFFAQGLLDTQHWMELEQLIDGMDLDMKWAQANIDFDRPGRIEYAEEKNGRIRNSLENFPNSSPSTLSTKPLDLRARFQRTIDNKEKRIDRFAPKGKFVTQYRKTGSQDPRLKEGRLC
ncbi:hypothetical protein EKO27_g4051 [Xylaria grammica]|uniref:Uncharacterized protein n=1 Tax=Xylaria grammica TaxID=363999 RepID=A0A439D9F9_9PEZI|nr:hypothetical protein EKO27_g4051 [Xylaria grammica]